MERSAMFVQPKPSLVCARRPPARAYTLGQTTSECPICQHERRAEGLGGSQERPLLLGLGEWSATVDAHVGAVHALICYCWHAGGRRTGRTGNGRENSDGETAATAHQRQRKRHTARWCAS